VPLVPVAYDLYDVVAAGPNDHPDRVLGNLGGTSTIDLETGETQFENVVFKKGIGDINGDGYRDFVGIASTSTDFTYATFFSDGATGFTYGEPVRHLYAEPLRMLPVADLDADQHDEILYSEYTEPFFLGYFTQYYGSRLLLHRGTPEGLAAEPAWALDVDLVVLQAITLQMDDDPQREILTIATENVNDITDVFNYVNLVVIDFDEQGQPFATDLGPIKAYNFSDVEQRLLPIGDLDGDGVDEVLLVAAPYDGRQYVASILARSTGWLEPIQILWPTPEQGIYGQAAFYGADVTTGDLNGDGRLDVAMTRLNYPEDALGGTVQIWWAPFLAPDENPIEPIPYDPAACGALPAEPAEDPTTGHTGTPEPEPLPEPEPKPTRRKPAQTQACGCQQQPFHAAWAFVLAFAWRRRGRR